MPDIEFTKKISISPQEIEDLLATAFEGGINYWCDAVEVDKEPTEDYTFASQALTRGGTLKVYVNEEDEIRTLTLEKILQAIADEQVDFDDYDAGVADSVVQRAAFGEVIYG